MADLLHNVPADLIRPSYNIYDYTRGIFKIVHFKNTMPFGCRSGEQKHYDHKLDPSISRAKRVVLELGLCNTWSYFCTFTVSGAKYDRGDLRAWAEKFTQWLRDQRKKFGLPFHYVLVPEQHADGSWHMHGFFDDSPTLVSFDELWRAGADVPWKLVKGGFYNWPAYQKKFGFCSFGKLRSPVGAAFYITKYIGKALAESCIPVNAKLYYNSQGLNRASFHGDVYGENQFLNSFMMNRYDFVETGFTSVKDKCDWTFALEYMDHDVMELFSHELIDQKQIAEFETYFEGVQEVLDGF